MSFNQEPHSFPLQFYTTASYPCSYIEGREARSQVVVPAHQVNAMLYSRLVRQGFRRSGMFTYRPHCDTCRACVSLRIPVAQFRPDRSQRRTLKRLASLQVRMLDLEYDDAHYALYQRYQHTRHAGGGMDGDDRSQYEQFLLRSPVDTCLVEYRESIDLSAQTSLLRMVSVVDMLDDGLSAVYTFYDPDHVQAGYGTYGILWLIECAQSLSLPYVYLGYWIGDCRKMAYKTRFSPVEVLDVQKGWVCYTPELHFPRHS